MSWIRRPRRRAAQEPTLDAAPGIEGLELSVSQWPFTTWILVALAGLFVPCGALPVFLLAAVLFMAVARPRLRVTLTSTSVRLAGWNGRYLPIPVRATVPLRDFDLRWVRQAVRNHFQTFLVSLDVDGRSFVFPGVTCTEDELIEVRTQAARAAAAAAERLGDEADVPPSLDTLRDEPEA